MSAAAAAGALPGQAAGSLAEVLLGLALGLLCLAALGEAFRRLLSALRLIGGVSRAESLGLRLIGGPALVPWVCLAMDLTGVPITRASLLAGALGLAAGALAWERRRAPALRGEAAGRRPAQTVRAGVGREAVAWMRRCLSAPAAPLLSLVAASLVLFSLAQVGLYPPREYDGLVGYDLVGKVLALEGKLRSSVFTEIRFNAQCVYPPFTSTNQGFWYLFHPAIPRLWVPWLAAGFALAMGGWLRRRTGSATAAALAVVLTLIVPELAFHLTVGQTDLPSMVYVTLGFFAFADRLSGRGRLAAVAFWMLLATTARNENVLFAAAPALIGTVALRGRRLRAAFVLLPAAGLFLFWNLLFVRGLIGYDPGEYFQREIPIDPGRMLAVLRYAAEIIAAPENYGELVWLIPLTLLAWAYGRFARGVKWEGAQGRALGSASGSPPAAESAALREDLTGRLLLLLAIAFVCYLPFFYLWNERLNPLWTMHHTFKRGFFRFIPGLLAAFVAAPPVLAWLRRCDEAGEEQGRRSR